MRLWPLIGLTALAMGLAGLYPSVDLWATGLFFDGQRFPLGREPALIVLRWVLRVSPFLLLFAGIAALLWGRRWPGLTLGLDRRGWMVSALTLVLGPGVMANLIFKRFWGRARPRQVLEFGGDKLFTAAPFPADQCPRNCSFVSGEVAGATALAFGLVLILLANRHRMGQGARVAAWALVLSLPLLSAFQRISAGAHFLSDAVLACLFTLLVAAVLQRLLPALPQAAPPR